MISFATCAYNEERSIAKAVKSVLPQMGQNAELIVITSGCSDNTVAVVKSIAEKRIRLIVEEKRKGKAAATNLLLADAKGEIIVYFDADVIVDRKAVAFLLSHFKSEQTGAVSARVRPFQQKTFFDKVVGFSRFALHKQKLKEQAEGRFWSLNGYLFAIRKGIVKKIDSSCLVEDALIGYLVRNKGYHVVYEPRAKVYEKAPQLLSDYINQKTRVRVGWLQMMRQYSLQFSEMRSISHLSYLFKNKYAWPYLLLEVIVWLNAKIKYSLDQLKWPQITSSKI